MLCITRNLKSKNTHQELKYLSQSMCHDLVNVKSIISATRHFKKTTWEPPPVGKSKTLLKSNGKKHYTSEFSRPRSKWELDTLVETEGNGTVSTAVHFVCSIHRKYCLCVDPFR